MKNIFIIGSKGISNYGGYETFVENLISQKKNKEAKYHVACIGNEKKEEDYCGARCFYLTIPNIGPAKAIYYDLKAIKTSLKYIKKNNIKDAIIYILACRIGPFLHHYKKQMKKLGVTLYINPDGHEWLRAKWSKPVKKYWKVSESLMVKEADWVVCDSKNIENYIKDSYGKYNPKTTFIAYGADLEKSKLKDNDVTLNNWYKEKKVQAHNYYLVVGRFVPENNYKTMISEFMKSNTDKDLVLITNVEKNKFYEKLREETGFEKDKRIKFVGTVYEKELIKKIRENAYGYLHGHSVGGTNPSLIEALATTELNLLYDVGFNREVAEDGALYWSLDNMNLANLIDDVDKLDKKVIDNLSKKAKDRIRREYTWKKIVNDYEQLFKEEKLSFRDVQLGEVDILKKIVRICDENNFKYSLAYGSLIGAVRHGGVIPWDDDIDIMMPRPDYEKFKKYCIDNAEKLNEKDDLKMFEKSVEKNYPQMIIRMSSLEYHLEFENEKDYGIGLFVDIYPLDGVGNDYSQAIKVIKKIKRLTSLGFLTSRKKFGVDNTSSKIKMIIKFPAYIWANIMRNEHYHKKINKLARIYDYNTSKYIACLVCPTGIIKGQEKDIFEKNIFDKLETHKFEDINAKIISDYDCFLTKIYGDYMTPPDEKGKKTHHTYIAYKRKR